jgi:ribose transport system substrate-binding protein
MRGKQGIIMIVVALGCAGAIGTAVGAVGQRTVRPGAEAKRLVAHAERPVAWRPPGPAFNTSKLRGKTIWYLSSALSVPLEQNVFKGLRQAAASVGAKAIGFDSKGQVTEYTRAIGQAIATKAAAIVVGLVVPSLVGPAIEDARKAGIPVLTLNTTNAGQPLPPGTPRGVVAAVTQSYSYPGRVEAAYVAADSGGKADAVYIVSRDAHDTKFGERAFVAEFKRVCPKCKLKVVDIPISQWTSLTTRVPSILAADPKVNYLVLIYDAMVLYAYPAVLTAGAQDRVKIVTFNGSPSVMKLLAQGKVVAADVGGANVWFGWAIADQAFRVIAGARPVVDIKVPQRLFDRKNIRSINLKAPESTWYSHVNFRQVYKKLWGVK